MQAVEAGEVEIGAIHDVESPGFGQEQVYDVDIMSLAVGDVDEGGDMAAQVEQGMQLHRRLGFAEMGPREQGQAKIDGR